MPLNPFSQAEFQGLLSNNFQEAISNLFPQDKLEQINVAPSPCQKRTVFNK